MWLIIGLTEHGISRVVLSGGSDRLFSGPKYAGVQYCIVE